MTASGPDLPRMQAELMAEVSRLREQKRRRVKAGASVGVCMVLAATTGATIHLLASREIRENTAYCYEGPSPRSHVQHVGDPSAHGGDRVERALDLCASVWRIGVLQITGGDPAPDGQEEFPVPPLFACEGDDGSIAVFPEVDGATCRSAGFSDLPQ